jgi:chromosome segregation ATPase
LKGGILSIVEVLNVTILALDNIRLQLALEVAKFKKENLRLAGHVSSLSDKVSTLTIEIGILMTTSDFIKEDKEHLEEELVRLKANNEIQNDLLEEQQAAVDKALADYNATQLELKVQISELEKTRREMTSVISNTKVISQALDHAVTSLTNSEASCQKKNQDFLDKLESFCTNDTTDANALRERLETTETTIDNATRDLSSDHLNDKELLVREERVIMELEALSLKAQEYVNNKENISNNKTKGLGASAPGGAGLFSKSASVQKMSEEGISYKVVSFR